MNAPLWLIEELKSSIDLDEIATALANEYWERGDARCEVELVVRVEYSVEVS